MKRLTFKEAVQRLDSEDWPRSKPQDIEFLAEVSKPVGEEQKPFETGGGTYYPLEVQEPGPFWKIWRLRRLLYVWQDEGRKFNFELAARLQPGDHILVVRPLRPKESEYYKDSAGNDGFWIASSDGKDFASRSLLLRLAGNLVCPECEIVNDADAKFCKNCAALLVRNE